MSNEFWVAEENVLTEMCLLSVGDMVEVPPVMAGLSPEMATMQVVKVDHHGVVFDVQYFGVTLRVVRLSMDEKGVFSWS